MFELFKKEVIEDKDSERNKALNKYFTTYASIDDTKNQAREWTDYVLEDAKSKRAEKKEIRSQVRHEINVQLTILGDYSELFSSLRSENAYLKMLSYFGYEKTEFFEEWHDFAKLWLPPGMKICKETIQTGFMTFKSADKDSFINFTEDAMHSSRYYEEIQRMDDFFASHHEDAYYHGLQTVREERIKMKLPQIQKDFYQNKRNR